MKRMLYLCCSFILVAHAAYAGEKLAPEALIAARVDALMDAMVKADADALKKLTSSALSYGHSGGHVENQAEFIEKIVSGRSDFLSIKLEDPSILVVDQVAIVRHLLLGETHDKDKEPATVHIGVIQVWHKEKGEWLMLARQAYKLPAAVH
jgi:hypothetical protein